MSTQNTQDENRFMSEVEQAMNAIEFSDEDLDKCLAELRPFLEEQDLAELTDDQLRLCMAQAMGFAAVLINVKEIAVQPPALEPMMVSVGFVSAEDAPGMPSVKAIALDYSLNAAIKNERDSVNRLPSFNPRPVNHAERLSSLRAQVAQTLSALGHAQPYFNQQPKGGE